MMKISKKGVDFIKKFECFIPKAYWDYKQWSIGYGSGTYENGSKVKEGEIVSEVKATSMLHSWLEKVVCPTIDKNVKVALNQSQYDALASFIYNVGNGAFEKSTMLKLINQNKIKEAAEQFDVWINAGGKPNQGLINRRKKEKELFLGGVVGTESNFVDKPHHELA